MIRRNATLAALLLVPALSEPLVAQTAPHEEPATDPAVEVVMQALSGVRNCWVPGAGESVPEVTVGFDIARDGRPDAASIRLLRPEGRPSGATRRAYDVARRAIIRCGAGGFKLPPESFALWRTIEMTFDPERMRNP